METKYKLETQMFITSHCNSHTNIRKDMKKIERQKKISEVMSLHV
jgi:hypothetical protein